MNSKTKKVLVPLVAIVFGFLLGAIIMLAFGYNLTRHPDIEETYFHCYRKR